jgi:hypothetical protein
LIAVVGKRIALLEHGGAIEDHMVEVLAKLSCFSQVSGVLVETDAVQATVANVGRVVESAID